MTVGAQHHATPVTPTSKPREFNQNGRIISKKVVNTLENVGKYSCRVYAIYTFKLDLNTQGIYAVYTLYHHSFLPCVYQPTAMSTEPTVTPLDAKLL